MAANCAITVICPTRGNPEFVELQLENFAGTIIEPSRARLLYYVDSDDPKLKDYQFCFHKMISKLGDQYAFEIVSGDPIGTPRAINLLAGMAPADAYMVIADDVVFETKGWDLAIDNVTEKYLDGIFNAWFDDGVFGAKLSWCPILGHRWFEALGYIVPVIFEHYAADQWLHTLGSFVGRNDFRAEQKLGQRVIDENAQEARYAWEVSGAAKRKMDRDNDAFARFERYLGQDCETLRAAISSYSPD